MQGRDSDTRWWTSPGRLVQRVLTLDDTPHSIALGTAIGMFVGLTPTVGIQMMVILAIAGITQRMFHFNRLAGVITVYVSNPLTIVPLYAAFYYIGSLMVDAPMSPAEFQERFEQTLNQGWQGWFAPLQFIFAEVAWRTHLEFHRHLLREERENQASHQRRLQHRSGRHGGKPRMHRAPMRKSHRRKASPFEDPPPLSDQSSRPRCRKARFESSSIEREPFSRHRTHP